MQKVFQSNILRFILLFATSLLMWTNDTFAADVHPKKIEAKTDTILHRSNSEMSHLDAHMVQSAYPVNVRVMGRAICVKSNYNQILPVYTQTGTFYASFRLNKGTNWLSGLPRGTYYINNHKITIS